ncbi:MAG: enoyl-CoA hydratase/isomerase family protein [Candidatus Hodarchaeales archaeon]|jgi:enoyl-CoA hydratase/carnithine racemase
MTYSNIIVTTENRITTIKINREKALNALNEKTIEELHDCVEQLSQSEDTKVVVITGVGKKSFIAGADITMFEGKSPITIRDIILRLQETLNKLEDLPIPVIASINGYCLGGGIELAMACDIRIASNTAIVGQPEINLGLIPGAGGTQRLTRLVGSGRAKEMIFLGENIDAETAKSFGLVNRVVPAENLEEETLKIASRLAKGPSFALNMAKEAINRGPENSLLDAIRTEGELFALCFAHEDVKEGVNAFLNKRKPNFK